MAYERFRNDRTYFDDDPREGRPVSVAAAILDTMRNKVNSECRIIDQCLRGLRLFFLNGASHVA